MKRLALALALFTTSLFAAPNPVTTVILVRHAEKLDETDQSPLKNPEGVDRAKELARVLSGVKVDAIYTTQFRRTKDTAAPLAASLGIPSVVRETGRTYAADLVKHILDTHRGQTVVVVGHSNTTIEVIKAFGVSEIATMQQTEFDNLYVLTDVEGAAPKVVALRFGAVAR